MSSKISSHERPGVKSYIPESSSRIAWRRGHQITKRSGLNVCTQGRDTQKGIEKAWRRRGLVVEHRKREDLNTSEDVIRRQNVGIGISVVGLEIRAELGQFVILKSNTEFKPFPKRMS